MKSYSWNGGRFRRQRTVEMDGQHVCVTVGVRRTCLDLANTKNVAFVSTNAMGAEVNQLVLEGQGQRLAFGDVSLGGEAASPEFEMAVLETLRAVAASHPGMLVSARDTRRGRVQFFIGYFIFTTGSIGLAFWDKLHEPTTWAVIPVCALFVFLYGRRNFAPPNPQDFTPIAEIIDRLYAQSKETEIGPPPKVP